MHIQKLLEFAMSVPRPDEPKTDVPDREKVIVEREAGEREKIIDKWNGWVSCEREKNSAFQIQFAGFNARAPEWKSTLLWGKDNWSETQDRLILDHIDLRGACLANAHLEEVQMFGAKLEGAKLHSAHLERARLSNTVLCGAVLCDAHLEGVEFGNAKLCGAKLDRACLKDANLNSAYLDRVSLYAAHLKGVDLLGAKLDGADFQYADFSGAKGLNYDEENGHRNWSFCDLTGTVFARCDLSGGDFTGAVLKTADFTEANVTGIKYKRSKMLGKYLGIRGIDSCYGNPEFRRDALDQDFIDQKYEDCQLLKYARDIQSKRFGRFLNAPPVRFLRGVRWRELRERFSRRLLFGLWSLSDYGRSMLGALIYVAATVFLIGALYKWFLIPFGHVELAGQLKDNPHLPYALWYAAAMGAATLGLTDLLHPLDAWGEAAMLVNVLAGLLLFGMLVAVMQNKFARRS